MKTCPLLCSVPHRAMITPVIPLSTSLVCISPSYWTIYHSFKIIVEWEMSIDWNSNPMCYANPFFSKNIQSDMNYILKNT